MAVLIIAEHDHKTVNPATHATVAAAQAMSAGDIHLLVAGHNAGDAAAQATKIDGVAKVLHADAGHYSWPLAENMEALVAPLASSYSHILAPATTTGKDIMPRIAAKLNVQQISDIIAVESADTFRRPIYAGNAIETVQSSDEIKVVTVRPSSFDKAGESGSASAEVIECPSSSGLSTYVSHSESEGDRPDLAAANIVISGGRGFGDGEKFNGLLEPLADKLGAAIGASRAAVDAGYVPNDYQVGQTGKIVAPELYIAIGISGAIQHLAGMKESKVIVAINKDENAPIFEIADYGLVGDLFDIVPELMEKL